MTPPILRQLHVADEPEAWRAAGFCVTDGVVQIGKVNVKLLGRRGGDGGDGGGRRGIVGWGLTNISARTATIDGIPCWCVAEDGSAQGDAEPSPCAPHANGSAEVDHLVLRSGDWRRTDSALAAHGLVCRRRRDDIYPGLTQCFYRDGGPIIELIAPSTEEQRQESKGDSEHPERAARRAAATAMAASVFGLEEGDSSSMLWGLTLAVGDLDSSKALLGEGASKVRDAKQPGRRIMTLRNQDFDISVNIAFISDHVAGAVPPVDRTGNNRKRNENSKL